MQECIAVRGIVRIESAGGLGGMQRVWLDYPAAARRVRRSEATVKRWRRDGLAFALRDGRAMVREDALLAWWRETMQADPAHQYRLRRDRREAGLPDRPIVRRGPKPKRASGTISEAKPLANVERMRGAIEWRVLQSVLAVCDPACIGLDQFTADEIAEGDLPMLQSICSGCDVIDQCRAFAAASRPGGFWAGRHWTAVQHS